MQATRFSNAPVPLEADVYLAHYADALKARSKHIKDMEKRLTGGKISIADFASAHEFFGLHKTKTGWVFREWAPLAESITLFGDFSNWEKREEFKLSKLKNGVWELKMPLDTLRHGDNYLMNVSWSEGNGDRIPAYARRVVQDEMTGLFCAVVWDPEEKYQFRYAPPAKPDSLLVYESHVGMAQEDPKVGSFTEFKEKILPRIARAGYNTVQLMAIMGHPYYGSFGYHVANFFAVSSRFGTPEELKALVDEAHRLGLRVIIDLVHSHAVRNEVEGLGRIDGTSYAYFHAGERGVHANWDSLCFDYGKPEVLHFLLSNCRFYLDEFNVDGFRFDGVTSMLYHHHGLGHCFTRYSEYFNNEVDEDAAAYLALANKVIHSVRPDAVTVAEDVSGMPGLGADLSQDGGLGFDYRMAMGVTDMWFKLLDQVDEHWNMFYLYGELTNRRRDERTISYVECHDQAIVGGKTAIFTMADDAMYHAMDVNSSDVRIERAVALHKMMRLATAASAGCGYLNFMGNEFGHPEWIDFPRPGNNWSLDHARRLWHLADATELRYRYLADFDRNMMFAILRTPDFYGAQVQQVRIDDEKKVLIFERNGFLFCFNFHPTASYTDYAFEAVPGTYLTVMDCDSVRYNGFGRRVADQTYHTHDVDGNCCLELYLPSRTALVLKLKKQEELNDNSR